MLYLKTSFVQLQYTYFAISHKIKTNRQWNLVSWENITGKMFLFKNYAENEAGRLVPDLFLGF